MLKVFKYNFLVYENPLNQVVKYISRSSAYNRNQKIIFNMNEANLKYVDGNDTFDFSFRYINETNHIDRQFNFSRKVNENVNAFLKKVDIRIQEMIKLKLKKKSKKRQLNEEDVPVQDNVETGQIFLLKDNSKISGEETCEEILLKGSSDLKLVVFDSTFIVKRNAPTVTFLALPKTIMIGFPCYPSKFEALYTDKKKSIFTWYKKPGNITKNTWTQVAEGYSYIPNVCDIGCILKLTCLPKNELDSGPEIQTKSVGTVEAGPGHCPFEDRHVFTKNKLFGNSFRVMSYNILADIYAHSNYSKGVLFSYCPTYALNMDYRKQLLLKEIIGFNADIICLQEVDSKIYTNDIFPYLNSLNYDGIHNVKNTTSEGLAIFFDQARYEKLDSTHSTISQDRDLPRFHEVWSKIESEEVKQTFLKRNTIVQVITLKSKNNPSEILLVGNTHLYFRPNADNIRLLQTYYVIMYINDIVENIKTKYPECKISIILAGDFNSVPECGVYQLITENFISEDHKDWRSNPSDVVKNISLIHEFKLSSACGTPEYTNYTVDFSGCLDYIFYQTDRLTVEQVVPMPSKEELALHDGLPSIVFPSDHISLCADFKWKE